MDDLISRQAAIDALRTCQTYLFTSYDDDKKISLESAEYMIEQLPSAQPDSVHVVRCEHCAHKKNCQWYYYSGDDYGYCSWAVKEDNGTES